MSKRTFYYPVVAGLVLVLLPSSLLAQAQTTPGNTNYTQADFKKLFKVMSGGNAHIELRLLPRTFRRQMEPYARNKGEANGLMSEAQFIRFMQEQQKRLSQPPKQNTPAKKTTSSANKKPPAKPVNLMSRQDFESRVKRETDNYFYGRDRNKSGFLDKSQVSSRLRSQFDKVDKDGDGKISYQESQAYIRSHLKRQYNQRISHWKDIPGIDPITINVDQSILDKRPIVYRSGNLPEELIDSWFAEADLDEDGQISLYEWREAGKELEDFDMYDRNGDGFITVEEVLYYQKYVAEPAEAEEEE